MIRIIIADDHEIVRAGLRQLIAGETDIEVAGEASDGQELIELLRKNRYDVVLLDISMPGRSGLDILKQIRIEHTGLPVLILSTYPEEQYAIRTIKAGASGYLNKKTLSDALIVAIRKAHSGGRYITPSLAEIMAESMISDHGGVPHAKLSDREYQIMLLLASGRSVSDISRDLFLSVKTVSTHRAKILQKMGLRNNAEITHYAVSNRLLD